MPRPPPLIVCSSPPPAPAELQGETHVWTRASSNLAQVGRQVGPKLPPGGVSAQAEIKDCAETLVVAPKWLQVAAKLAKVGSKLARAGSKLAQVGRQVGPKLPPGGVLARAEIKACAETLVVAPKWLQVVSKLAKVGSNLARAGSKLGRLGCQVGPPLAQAGVPAWMGWSIHSLSGLGSRS